MTERRREQLGRLKEIQNTERYWNQDIMTITAFMDDAEVEKHIGQCGADAEGR